MLTSKDIDPELKTGQNVIWMTEIRDTIKNKIIVSARDIQDQKKDMEDDPNYKSGFKNMGASKIKSETSILLRNSEGKTQVYKVNTGNEGGEDTILTSKDLENQPNLSGGDQERSLGGDSKMKTCLYQILKKMTHKYFPYWGQQPLTNYQKANFIQKCEVCMKAPQK